MKRTKGKKTPKKQKTKKLGCGGQGLGGTGLGGNGFRIRTHTTGHGLGCGWGLGPSLSPAEGAPECLWPLGVEDQDSGLSRLSRAEWVWGNIKHIPSDPLTLKGSPHPNQYPRVKHTSSGMWTSPFPSFTQPLGALVPSGFHFSPLDPLQVLLITWGFLSSTWLSEVPH